MFAWEKDAARADMLVLVDGLDRETGTATKLRAHAEGLLHRAFSVVVWRRGEGGQIELLLSRRATGKYHSAGLWANSCCSHPRAGEGLAQAAARRCREELGIALDACAFDEIGAFAYRAEFAGGLSEYEYDHVFLAEFDEEPAPDPAEISGVRWMGVRELAAELAEHPERFAVWAFTVLPMAMARLRRPFPRLRP